MYIQTTNVQEIIKKSRKNSHKCRSTLVLTEKINTAKKKIRELKSDRQRWENVLVRNEMAGLWRSWWQRGYCNSNNNKKNGGEDERVNAAKRCFC